MADFQELILVDAGPEDVFRLIAGVESWQYLMPHVRSVDAVRPARWRIRISWRWLPVQVALSGRINPGARMAEFRVASSPGIQAGVRWIVHSAADDSASIRVEATVVRAPAALSGLARWVVRDLCRDSLEMVRLLAESDRIAHQGIEV